MAKLKYNELVKTLRECGLQKGDIVHIQSDLRLIGPVDSASTREAILDFYFYAIKECIGEEGTISVPTFTWDYGDKGQPFIKEETPCDTGVFSEFIRKRKDSIRSIHPLVSVTACGRQAQELCDIPHHDGYGYVSPWGKLHELNAQIVALGLGSQKTGGSSIIHYCEALYGVPYRYTKLFTTPAYSEGKLLNGPFTMYVRHKFLNCKVDASRFKKNLVDQKFAREFTLGNGSVFCCEAKIFVDKALELLSKDRYTLLNRKPEYAPDQIPMI